MLIVVLPSVVKVVVKILGLSWFAFKYFVVLMALGLSSSVYLSPQRGFLYDLKLFLWQK